MSQENLLTQRAPQLQDAHSLFDDLVPLAQESCCGGEGLIGPRLRLLRRQQKLSIRTLASKCGISVNTLSLIENDRTSPSIHTLQLLARGLGVPLITLFEEDKPGCTLVYQKQGQRPLMRFTNGTLEKLGEGLPPLPLGAEPILVTLDAGQADASDISHVGREFIYCLEGKVSCIVANHEYLLSPGDSLLFDARSPHHWLNSNPTSSKILVLFCPMEGHDLPAEHHLAR
jgi:transcriptional regulator with XRE-family HTH domain